MLIKIIWLNIKTYFIYNVDKILLCIIIPLWFQEEPGETLGGDSNRGSMWTCPLCQESQPDRENLSFHLTDKHSVLPACLEKLLDIVSIFAKVDSTFSKCTVQKSIMCTL